MMAGSMFALIDIRPGVFDPTVLGAVAAVLVVAFAALIVWSIRARTQRMLAIARQIQEEQEGKRKKLPEAEPEPELPATPEPAPVLAPGEKLTFEAPRSLGEGLGKTREGLVGRIRSALGGKAIDPSVLDDLEEILFTSDLGVKTSTALLATLREKMERKEAGDLAALQAILKKELRAKLGDAPPPRTFSGATPYVVMVVGVNGVGKTTTIGKLAKKIADGEFGGAKKKVMLGAGDTFRAAAAEQLDVWGRRAGCEVISNKEGTDPSAVAFDAARAAKARGADVLIVDTAGRLHTKTNLMEELKKVKRILGREIPGAPHETILVVDATTGQNALNQAREFHEGVGVTGIVLTKLDGTAKGGIVVGIKDELSIPVLFIGIGEKVEDLRSFDPDAFVDALFA